MAPAPWPVSAVKGATFGARLDSQDHLPPGATHSGILFTNPHRKTHVLNVDLLGQQTMFPFTLFLPVPGEYDVEAEAALHRLAAASEVDYVNPEDFRYTLEQLPCCADEGDPLNVVFVGDVTDIAAALIRRNFRLRRQPDDNKQILFGRPPDLVARRVGQTGVPANWLRMWVAPLQYQDKAVLLVQSARPLGGRYNMDGVSQQTLHPDTDESRNLLIQDLLYSGGLAQLGFVRGVGAIPETLAAETDGESRYYTDGLRAVLFFVPRPLALDDVEILDWVPAMQQRIDEAASGNSDKQDHGKTMYTPERE